MGDLAEVEPVTLAGRAVWFSLMVTAMGCGGSYAPSPAAPTSATTGSTPASSWAGPAIGGSWSGAWTYTVSGVKAADDVRVTFTPAGTTMAGQLTASGGVTATLTFTQPSPLSGTALLTVVLLSGSTCTGNGTMTATLAGDELRVAIPSFTSASGVCTVWASDSTLTLKRSG